MKNWNIIWDDPNSQGEALFGCKARDIEHAIRQWKRENPRQPVRRILKVYS